MILRVILQPTETKPPANRLRVILQIEKCLTGAEAEEKRGAAESLAPTDPSSVDE